MYNKILVPLDGSDLAEAILSHVCTLAKQFDAEIVLLRVPLYPMLDYPMSDATLIMSVYDSLQSEVQDYLLRTAGRLTQDGFKVTTAMRNGPVADTIVEYANEIHADLIALSTHGRGGFSRWLIGSVADKVVRSASVPVLLLRPSAQPKANEDNVEREKDAAG
jgi:nucleotide-binding universal stress UspA family protein